jgi:coiled-coil domain-containing protein 55
MQRYGLQLRTKPAASSSSRAPPPPPARPLAAFADDDDDDVEAEILRQAAKKRALQKVTRSGHHPMRKIPTKFVYRATR